MHGGQEGSRLIEMVEDSFVLQIVTQSNRGNNTLDLVLTTDADLISDCEVLNGCDHHTIWFRIRTNHQLTVNKFKVPDYRNANFDLARELLLTETWEQQNGTSLEQEWSTFRDKLIDVERMTVPMKFKWVNGATKPPWRSADIRAVNVLKTNYNSIRETATVETRERYQRSLKACRTLIRQSKRDYEKRTARESKTNPKKFFMYITSIKKVKYNIGPLADESGELTQDNRHMVRILNKKFSSVFTIENMESVPVGTAPPSGVTPLEINTNGEQEVQKYLDSLDVSKSTGPDNLSPKLPIELKQQILKPLTSI